MVMIRLGKKGQVSLPKALLRQVGITGETPLIAEAGQDGAIVLRQAVVYPVEIYGDERIEEFLSDDALTPADRARVRRANRRSGSRRTGSGRAPR